MFCCDSVNVTINETLNKAEVLTAVSYRKYVNTLIPTLFQSKSSNFWVPWSQSPQTNANRTITLKKILSSMLVLVPAIHVNDMQIAIINSSPSHSEHSDTQLWHRLFSHSFYWLKADRDLFFVYKSVQCVIRTTKSTQILNTSCQRLGYVYRCTIIYSKAACTDSLMLKNYLFENFRKQYNWNKTLMKKVNTAMFFLHIYQGLLPRKPKACKIFLRFFPFQISV